MRISPIKSFTNPTNKSFKGYTVHDKSPYQGYEPTTHKWAATQTGRPIEKTLGSFHNNITGNVYYADPLEQVSDQVRETVDYVVYDKEPPFPDIEKNVSRHYFEGRGYFNNTESDFNKFREYFYRLEMADSKTVGEYERKAWSNINPQESREKSAYFQAHVRDAKYNQETAANCLNIFRESQGLRDEKDAIDGRVKSSQGVLDFYNKEVPLAAKELENRKELDTELSSKIQSLEERKASYTNILAQLEKSNKGNESAIRKLAQTISCNQKQNDNVNSYERYNSTEFLSKPVTINSYDDAQLEFFHSKETENKEKANILASIKNLDETIESYKKKLDENKALIKKISDYANELPEIISKQKAKVEFYTKQFEQAKADLIPYFDKLKNYFNSRGIKVIR